MRFLLIDRITSWEVEAGRGSAVKNVALSEDFFDDHFPLKPIMPGALLLEGLAQLGGLLLEEGLRKRSGRNAKALLSIVEKAKFRRPARPGDSLEYRAEVVAVSEAGGKVAAEARAGEERIADCTLVFSFHDIHLPRLEASRARVLALWLRDLPGR